MRAYGAALAGILCFAAAPRVWFLLSESVDGDELFSRNAVLASVSSMLELAQGDLVHPPLYYLVLKGFCFLAGTGLVAMRLPSLAFGLANIAALASVARLGRTWTQPALLAALALSLNADHIYQSERARSYGLYGLLVMVLLLWCSQIEERGDRRNYRYWLSGWFLMTAIVYTHYVGALYIASLVLAVAASRVDRERKYHIIAAAGVAASLLVPWLLWLAPTYVARGGLPNIRWIPTPTWSDLATVFADFLGTPPFRGAVELSLLVGGLLFAAGVIRGIRSPFVMATAACAVIPPVALFALSRVGDANYFHARHLLPSAASWLLLVFYGAHGLAVRTALPNPAAAALTAVAMAFSLGSLPPRDGFREPFAAIALQLNSAELRELPAYAANHYVLGWTVNHHAQSFRVMALPETPPESEEFLVLHRPSDLGDSEIVERLATHACAATDERQMGHGVILSWYYCSPPEDR